jgi:hypothetical protein
LRPKNRVRLNLEPLERRELLSGAALISTISEGFFNDQVSYAVQPDLSVSMHLNGGPRIDLGGTVTQISAGLDTLGQAQVFGIAPSGSVWVHDKNPAHGWQPLYGNVSQISASRNNRVFGLTSGGSVWVRDNTPFVDSWAPLYGTVTQISAGTAGPSGGDQVFGIDPSGGVWVRDATPFVNSWAPLYGHVSQISASRNNRVFGLASDGSVWVRDATPFVNTWAPLYGTVTQISVGTNFSVEDQVYGIDPSGGVWVRDATPFVDSWHPLYGNVTQISATDFTTVIGSAPSGTVWARYDTDSSRDDWVLLDGGTTHPLAGAAYSPASGSLFGPHGPSYLNVESFAGASPSGAASHTPSPEELADLVFALEHQHQA